ncbi:sorting nexin-11 isoform X2 [Boleophthalmus pectinirostris]|uniref:sorting nexin-11 isoform X2 n=1 Tax=Boleophthalmus pectinirostris TaxID=150288 RepID=UPI002430D8A5|nr:sorting nexin-11 isoform X2 [Boleophthalmus pectinirostris]
MEVAQNVYVHDSSIIIITVRCLCSLTANSMISNQEEDEFVAVRVQDPRIQNEGSWNSYVDYKIFLHTNSKAFTAKTSCVRRRYSEFVWLKKKLQKNAGLVPVPDLPGKSLFSFSNDDFLERRRKGLQRFLDKVVHMTVCLSDSQLHLFLQTQLPVGHIQDCVQGHTPYTVTDAILTYASSNRGYAQAQEEEPAKERSLTVSYESMESPVPHQPSQLNKQLLPESSKPVDHVQQDNTTEPLLSDSTSTTSIQVHQTNDHLKAVVENSKHVSFFLGDRGSPENLCYKEQEELPGTNGCVMEESVELHSPTGPGFEETEEATIEENTTEQKEEHDSCIVSNSEEESEVNCNGLLNNLCEVTVENVEVNQADVLEKQVESKKEDAENDLKFQDDMKNELGETVVKQDYSNGDVLLAVNSEVTSSGEESNEQIISIEHEENENMHTAFKVEVCANEFIQQIDPHMDQTKDKSIEISNSDIVYEDRQSLQSSNESIVKVSDEESIGDDAEVMREANGDIHTEVVPQEITGHWSETGASSIFTLHMNGCPLEAEERISNVGSIQEEIEIVKGTNDLNNTSELTTSGNLESNESESVVDLTENSDFSILATSCVPESVDLKLAMGENLCSSMSLDASEDSIGVPLAEPVLNGDSEIT